jgi:L-iditol 2-dehydrogenase
MVEKMTAAVLHGPEDVRFEEVDVPEPGPEEVLVRVEAASVDFTDRKVFQRGHHPMIQPPALFGHEWAGMVARAGAAARARWPEGTRVVGANSAPCGPPDAAEPCRMCRRDRHNLCERLLYLNGAFAPYLLVPARVVRGNLHEIPADLPFEEAALAEPLACVAHAVRRLPLLERDRAAVLGCGPIGLLFVAALRRAHGARIRIAAYDHHEERLDAARAFGADETARGPGGPAAEVVVEAVGSVSAHEEGLALTARGGTFVPFGGIARGDRWPLDIGRVHYEEVRILPVYHHTPRDFAEAAGMIARREIPVARLISRRLPLRELPRALDLIARRDGLRTILLPWNS